MLELDKIYNMDCMEGMKQVPNNYIDLIIADPPYNIGKDTWDKYSNKDYFKLIKKWIIEFQRVLKNTGSLYLWHNDFPTLARINIFIEEHTNFIFKNQLIWDKYNGNKKFGGFLQGFIELEGLRNYQKMAEYCLFYTFQDIYKGHSGIFDKIRQSLNAERKRAKLSLKQVNQLLGVSTNGGGMACHYFSEGNKLWELPTSEAYEKLQSTGYFNKPYEELREEYEELLYTFNNNKSISSIIPCELAEDFGHPTQKPVKIYREFILNSTKETNLVLDPFVGSGTCPVACRQTGRQFIGFEIDKKFFDIAVKRLKNTPIGLGHYDKQIKLDKYQT